MKKPKTVFNFTLFTFRAFLLTPIFLLCFMFTPMFVDAQNSKSAQWQSVGGEKLLSGNHNFTQSWSSHAYSRQDGNKWWRGGFWGERKPLIPWENTVANSVTSNKGQITVLGPCNIGLYQRAKGARIYLTDAETKAGFTAWTSTISFSSQVWSGAVKEFNKGGEFWGFVPAGKEVTLNVTAIMSVYNNQGGTGEISYNAPQDIEYEIWFFPRGDGCKVIGASSDSGKPMPGDLYYTDKECK